jgi:hypothetical protein
LAPPAPRAALLLNSEEVLLVRVLASQNLPNSVLR